MEEEKEKKVHLFFSILKLIWQNNLNKVSIFTHDLQQ